MILTIFTKVWKHDVQKGDTVIDATFGNGYDTLAMINILDNELARVVFMQWIFRMMFREYFFFARRVAQSKLGALFSQFLSVFYFFDTRSGRYKTSEVFG